MLNQTPISPSAASPRDRRTTASEAVVTAVADAEGVDPTDLEPLFDVVDPDALDALFAGGDASVELTFNYAGYAVTVRGVEDVSLSER
ncbi:MAG: HalOD1 output domain-containing protein [Haloarculaceae archaeon]